MTDEHQGGDEGVVHYEGGIPVFNTRLDNLENEAREAKHRDNEYKDEQLRLNRRLAWFTGVLAAVGIAGGFISSYQAHSSGVNAAAAQANADAARGMVEEMKKSGNDTRELAVQAKNQADRTKDLADRALAQANATRELAGQAKRAADANKEAADAAKTSADTLAAQLELTERPWVDADITLDGPFTFDVNGANILFKISLRNTGHSPALSVGINSLVLIGTQGADAPSHRDQACQEASRIAGMLPRWGMALFPVVRFEQQYGVTITKEEIEKRKTSKEFPGSNFGDLYSSPLWFSA